MKIQRQGVKFSASEKKNIEGLILADDACVELLQPF